MGSAVQPTMPNHEMASASSSALMFGRLDTAGATAPAQDLSSQLNNLRENQDQLFQISIPAAKGIKRVWAEMTNQQVFLVPADSRTKITAQERDAFKQPGVAMVTLLDLPRSTTDTMRFDVGLTAPSMVDAGLVKKLIEAELSQQHAAATTTIQKVVKTGFLAGLFGRGKVTPAVSTAPVQDAHSETAPINTPHNGVFSSPRP